MAKREAAERPRWKRKLLRYLLTLLVFCGLLLGVFLYGMHVAGREAEPEITGDLLQERLRGVEELVSVEYHYTNMGKFENQVDFYGWKVPFTTKSFIVSYDGVIKAGVDLSAVQIAVTDQSVTVTLPAAQVLSHEIPEDSIEVFDETRNLFNPIKIEDYTSFTLSQKQTLEQRAAEGGLLIAANERACAAVRSLLELVPGMEEYTLDVRTAS